MYPPSFPDGSVNASVPVVQGQPVQGVAVAQPMEATTTIMPAEPTAAQMAALTNFPAGLVKALMSSLEAFPVRFFVVDNSGSMQTADGNRLLVDAQGRAKMIRATRWEELTDTVHQIGTLTTALSARTDFHLLTPRPVGQHFSMANDGSSVVQTAGAPLDFPGLQRVMATSPGGSTPLTESLLELISLIEPCADKLRAKGQQAVVILATDGLPNDPPSFLAALQERQRWDTRAAAGL